MIWIQWEDKGDSQGIFSSFRSSPDAATKLGSPKVGGRGCKTIH